MAVLAAAAVPAAISQSLPSTVGESLSGKAVVLANAVRGRAAVLVAGFSKDAGPACDDWMKALRADPALAQASVFQVVMLQQAPGFIRGLIKGAMRKGLSPAQQDAAVVLTQDESLWRAFFGVSSDKAPCVVLLDPAAHPLWHGCGAARDLEPLLKAALR